MRAAKKGRLLVGDLSVQVALFQGIEETTLATHLYHDSCDQSISMPRMCLDHPEMMPISTYNAVNIGDHRIRIDWQERKRLLQTDITDWPTVGSIALDKLPQLMATNKLVMGGRYVVMPENSQFVKIGTDAAILRALADRLRVQRMALVVQAPVLKCMRYCLLVSVGTNMQAPATLNLLPLMFNEELRPLQMTHTDSQYGGLVDLALKQVPKAMPQLTNKPLVDRIELWLKNRMPKPKRMRVVKSKDKVGV